MPMSRILVERTVARLESSGTFRRTPVFMHGDPRIVHVLEEGDEASGVGDWSEGGQGDV
jgi:aminoglycoside phosphotransferase (APT) family kinase protein